MSILKTDTSLMRPIKRFLVFSSELGILVLGFVLSLAIAMDLASSENTAQFAPFVFYSSLILTVVAFFVLRRQTRAWKIRYDAVGWKLRQAERKLHPARARYKRIVRRNLVWVPSAIAAFVLFFFPFATHLAHPRPLDLMNYRIPIPWTFTVFRSSVPQYSGVEAIVNSSGMKRFGITPFWDGERRFSLMNFVSTNGPLSSGLQNGDWMPRDASQLSTRKLRANDVGFTCRQYLRQPRRPFVFGIGPLYANGPFWEINCQAAAGGYKQVLDASFFGREEDIPEFYSIIAGVRFVN